MNQAELRNQLKENHIAAWGWALLCCRGDRDMAEDVLHDTYLQILEGKARFGGRSTFKTWLFAVIRNLASRHRYGLSRGIRFLKESLMPDMKDPEEVDARLHQVELQQRLSGLLEKLPTRQRQLLHLVFYQEVTIEQAASILGISIGSARTHYQRGKARLRNELEKAGLP